MHWTGNKGQEAPESKPEEEKSEAYARRLVDYYENGLYTEKTKEDSITRWKVKDIVRVCFTEIRLNQVQRHAQQYGKLGMGFKRDFVIQKGGRPIIYVPLINQNDSSLLEDSIRKIRELARSKELEQFSELKTLRKSIDWIMAHVKRMSDGPDEDYSNLEEMEWRVVYDEIPGKHFIEDQVNTGQVYRLPFSPTDVQLIVFPDNETKLKALENEQLKPYLKEHMPILATLDDCGNF